MRMSGVREEGKGGHAVRMSSKRGELNVRSGMQKGRHSLPPIEMATPMSVLRPRGASSTGAGSMSRTRKQLKP